MDNSLKYVRLTSYILSSSAISFKSCCWCPSREAQTWLTLTSALAYLVFNAVALLADRLKNPRKPFSFSSTSKLFSSVTREDSISPTSPISFVRTFFKAVSEKSAIFFCVPTPYCRIACELLISIWWEKFSTICNSSGVRLFSEKAGSCAFSERSVPADAAGDAFSVCGVTSKVSVGVVAKSFNSSLMATPFFVLLWQDLFSIYIIPVYLPRRVPRLPAQGNDR